MRRIYLALVFVTAGVPAALAQQDPSEAALVPRLDLSVGYSHVNANAPPGISSYFGPNGGYLSAGYRLNGWLGVAGEFTGGHAGNISQLGQNLTLLTYMAGPRVTYSGYRFVPYGQVLFGGAHGSDSYFPSGTSYSTSASSWALSAGGGLDIGLTRRLAVRAVEAQYLRTVFPNGSTNVQSHLMLGAGLVFRFGHVRHWVAASTPVMDRKSEEISFNCNSNAARIDQGDTLQIVGHTMTEPDKLDIRYSWTSSGGNIEGGGRLVTINTTGMALGTYHVTGHAVLVSAPTVTADCDVDFQVGKHEVAAASSGDANRVQQEQLFHQNVPDALFDYDSYQIRPDAHTSIEHAASYLNDHPAIGVLVEGYADDRGSAEYNLALGEKRANAARDALISAGVPPGRVEIISYGKEAQVCTAQDENCWQRNRRAAFSMHP